MVKRLSEDELLAYVKQLEAEKAQMKVRMDELETENTCLKAEQERQRQCSEQEGHSFTTKRITDYGNGLPSWEEGKTLQSMCSSFLMGVPCSAHETEMVNSMSQKYIERTAPPRQAPDLSVLKTGVYTDEQVARAITSICGKGRALDSKRKWAAVYWYLRWAAGYPVNAHDFCLRIATLPLPADLPFRCDYTSIRHDCTATFMNQDAREVDRVKPSQMDIPFYQLCREVVLALARALEAEAKA